MDETVIPRARKAEEELKETLLTIAGELLDNYYEERPHSNAYGVQYTGDYSAETQRADDDDAIPHGIWFLGRSDGSDGGDNDSGVDYIVRKHSDPDNPRGDDERHYLFGDYGWPRYIDQFRQEIDLFTDVIESAVEEKFLTDAHLDRYNLAIERYEDALYIDRQNTSLDAIADAIRNNDMDFLRPILVEDGEDGRNIWKLLFSKDANGEVVEKDVSVPVVSEGDGLIFAYTDRQFHERNFRGKITESKTYAFGVVIGIDDTEEVFFVHRLQSDSDLRGDLVSDDIKDLQQKVGLTEEEVREKQEEMNISRLTADKRIDVIESLLEEQDFDLNEWEELVQAKKEDARPEWTAALVKEKMGFDLNYNDIVGDDLPLGTTIRVQGDLALQRHDYRTVFWEYYEDVLENKKNEAARGRRDYNPLEDDEKEYEPWEDFLNAHPRFSEATTLERYRDEELNIRGLSVRGKSPGFSVSKTLSTDEMKELQDEIDLSEEDVREEQQRQGISRLSSSKRAKVIEDLLMKRAFDWMYENAERMPSKETLQVEAEEETRDVFEDVDKQVNEVLGNHTVIIGPAREHPYTDFGDRDTLAAIIVPEKTTLIVWHDEHNNVKSELGPGVYEFRFLEGHEDGWWRPSW